MFFPKNGCMDQEGFLGPISRHAQLKGHEAAVYALSASGHARCILSGGGEGWIAEWNLDAPDKGRLLARMDAQVFALLRLSSGEIVAGDMNGGLHWISPGDPARNRDVAHHRKGVFSLLEVGGSLFTAGGDGRIGRWSIAEQRSVESLQISAQRLRALDYCPQRHEIAVGSSDGNIYILDADNMDVRHTLEQAHASSVFAVRYSPDGQRLFSGGRDAMLRTWELEKSWRAGSVEPAHWFTINAIAVHPERPLLATASRDKTIKIWDAQNLRLLKVLEAFRDKGHPNSVNALLWVDPYLVSASDDRTLMVWSA
jgi:WD40 repeat protein